MEEGKKMRKRIDSGEREILTRMMNEHVVMPGFPALVVTREFLYFFLRGCGWCPCERGFGSMEYLTFGRRAVTDDLTDEATRDRLLGMVRSGYLRDERTAA